MEDLLTNKKRRNRSPATGTMVLKTGLPSILNTASSSMVLKTGLPSILNTASSSIGIEDDAVLIKIDGRPVFRTIAPVAGERLRLHLLVSKSSITD